MPARKLEAYEFEQAPESNQTPLYQDYTPEAPVGPNLKEILFRPKRPNNIRGSLKNRKVLSRQGFFRIRGKVS